MDAGSAEDVLGLLAERGQLPVTSIAEELDRHPVTVDRQCHDLQQDGYIRIAASGGAYALTGAGRDRLAGSTSDG